MTLSVAPAATSPISDSRYEQLPCRAGCLVQSLPIFFVDWDRYSSSLMVVRYKLH